MEHRGGLVPHADDEGLWMCWSFDPNRSLAQGRARPGAGPCPDVPGPGLGPGPARPVRKKHCKSVSDCKFSLANGYCSYDACALQNAHTVTYYMPKSYMGKSQRGAAEKTIQKSSRNECKHRKTKKTKINENKRTRRHPETNRNVEKRKNENKRK